jgi:hypothetical protein
MSRVVIPKTDLRRSFADPSPAWGREKSGELFIRCQCGLCMGLDLHTVEPNGDVSPSLHHDDPKCGWHVYATLADWDPVPMPR